MFGISFQPFTPIQPSHCSFFLGPTKICLQVINLDTENKSEEHFDLGIKMSDSKTLECMVCGKTFSRGPVDLARHQTAITLKHLVSTTSSAQFSFGCRKCNIYFTSKDHLSLHRSQSSCGRPSSKPVVVTSTSAIVRPKPVKEEPTTVKSESPVVSTRGTPRLAASVAAAAIAAFSGVAQVKEKPPASPARPTATDKAPLPDKMNDDGATTDNAPSGVRHSARVRHPNPFVSPDGVYTSKSPATSSGAEAAASDASQLTKGKRGRPPSVAKQVPASAPPPPEQPAVKEVHKKPMSVDEFAEYQRTNKRPRIIIPEGSLILHLVGYLYTIYLTHSCNVTERKTYYALLSLLIDKDSWSRRNHPAARDEAEPPGSNEHSAVTPAPQDRLPTETVNIITVGQSPSKPPGTASSSSGGSATTTRAHQSTQTGPLSRGEVKAASPGSQQPQDSRMVAAPVGSNTTQVYASEAEQETDEYERHIPADKLALLKTIQT